MPPRSKVLTLMVGVDRSASPPRLLVLRSPAEEADGGDTELSAAWADLCRTLIEPIKASCDLQPVTPAIAEAARLELDSSLERGLWSWRSTVEVRTQAHDELPAPLEQGPRAA